MFVKENPDSKKKASFLGVPEPTEWLAALSTPYALCNREGKQTFVKNEKKYLCTRNLNL